MPTEQHPPERQFDAAPSLGAIATTSEHSTERRLAGIVSEEMETALFDAWMSVGDQSEPSEDDKQHVEQRLTGSVACLTELHEYIGEDEAGVEEFIQTFGIINFYRYDAISLYDQFLHWRSGNLEVYDTLMIVAREGDENSAYANVAIPFTDDKENNVLVFEVSPQFDEVESVMSKVRQREAEASYPGRISLLVLSAHGVIEEGKGGKKEVAMRDLGIDGRTEFELFADSASQLAVNTAPTIVLDSCLTGKEIDSEASLAQKISTSLTDGYVVAPDQVVFRSARDDIGALRFDNKASEQGNYAVFSVEHMAETRRLRGRMLAAKTMVFRNGQKVSQASEGYQPSKVRKNFKSKRT